MTTDLDIDQKLLNAAMLAGGHNSETTALTEALIEYIQKREQASIVELFGTIAFDDGYHYKDERKKDTCPG